MIEAPAARQIDSWSVAEENAAQWMRYWGHVDAACTSGGADGGVDVRSRTALAQVKFEAAQVGSPAVQRLVGARGRDHHLALYFFSGAGYAQPAIQYADVMEVALFKYDLTGRQTAVNLAASEVVRVSSARSRATASQDVSGALAPRKPRTSLRWWGRNWSLLVGMWFFMSAYINGAGIVHRPDVASNDPVALSLTALGFISLWSWMSRRRRHRAIASLSESGWPPHGQEPMSDTFFGAVLKTPGVAEALARGKKIPAIKFYRDANPALGLRQCKDIIDAVEMDPRYQTLMPGSTNSDGGI
jgi:hypothetical protein